MIFMSNIMEKLENLDAIRWDELFNQIESHVYYIIESDGRYVKDLLWRKGTVEFIDDLCDCTKFSSEQSAKRFIKKIDPFDKRGCMVRKLTVTIEYV